MDGKRLLERIRLTNFLSFGPQGEEVKLEPLNVLIGPNAVGKSNFVAAINLFEAIATASPRYGVGMPDLLWKGGAKVPVAEIEANVAYLDETPLLQYRFCFTAEQERMVIVDETLANVGRNGEAGENLYRFETGMGLVELTRAADKGAPYGLRDHEMLPAGTFHPNRSILVQLKDPVAYPELTYLGRQFERIATYPCWNWGPRQPPRVPAAADLPGGYLLEDASNLALVLNDLLNHANVKQRVYEHLGRYFERFEELLLSIRGGTVDIQMREAGLARPISAARLSDGTLRFLCLLAVLCHPEPPPLICLDEPEVGLHPDALGFVADLLIDASKRTQLIVTTHSDVLISALSAVPEAVLVCERDDAGTHLRRLKRGPLESWLEKYALGEIWQMGEIGGRQ